MKISLDMDMVIKFICESSEGIESIVSKMSEEDFLQLIRYCFSEDEYDLKSPILGDVFICERYRSITTEELDATWIQYGKDMVGKKKASYWFTEPDMALVIHPSLITGYAKLNCWIQVNEPLIAVASSADGDLDDEFYDALSSLFDSKGANFEVFDKATDLFMDLKELLVERYKK